MKKYAMLLLAVLPAVCVSSNHTTAGEEVPGSTLGVTTSQPLGDEWELVWHDEFDGSGDPDWQVWQSERGFERNEEYQWYQPQNAYRENGMLVLEARLDSIPNPNYQEGSRDWRRNRPFARYSSGSIKTRGSFSFQYGRMEVRASIPAVMGSWPAIWTLGDKMPWPSCGEVDVMEFYHVKGRPSILANTAWGNDKPNNAVWNTQITPLSHFTERDMEWADKFHVWRMDWDEHAIDIYLDDELLNHTDLDSTFNGTIGQGRNPFRQPHYILLDLAIGGQQGGQPIPETFPLRYKIDYVRVYQRKK